MAFPPSPQGAASNSSGPGGNRLSDPFDLTIPHTQRSRFSVARYHWRIGPPLSPVCPSHLSLYDGAQASCGFTMQRGEGVENLEPRLRIIGRGRHSRVGAEQCKSEAQIRSPSQTRAALQPPASIRTTRCGCDSARAEVLHHKTDAAEPEGGRTSPRCAASSRFQPPPPPSPSSNLTASPAHSTRTSHMC
jgi:hypothetical protein